jgi:hypothetical protein
MTAKFYCWSLQRFAQPVAVWFRRNFIDGDGISTRRAFLERWRRTEGIAGATIQPFDESRFA